MKVKSLSANLFKGFKKTKIKLGDGLNLLVGGNNSGKSSILQGIYLAFHFLRLTGGISEFDAKKGAANRLRGITVKSIPLPFHEESYLSEGLKKRSRREQSTSLVIEGEKDLTFKETVTFPGGNLLVISSDAKDDIGNVSYRKKVKEMIDDDKNIPLFIPTFSGVSTREEMKMEEVVKHYIASGRSGEVLRNQLTKIAKNKKYFERLNSYLKTGFGVEIVSNDTKEIYLSSLYKDSDYGNLDISSAGSGFQQILQILVYIVTSNASTVLIDEPDAHLHHRLQHILYDILLEMVNDGRQIIVATHSQVFIQRAIRHNDRLILVNKSLEKQIAVEEYSEGLKVLYQEGVIDETEVTKGASINLIALEDKEGGHGFNVMKEFLQKAGFREPQYRIISIGDHIYGYVSGKEKIDKVKLKSLIFQDSDSLPEQYLKKLEKEDTKAAVSTAFLRVHEVENYLLNAVVIARVIENKRGNKVLVAEIKKLIEETANEEKDELIDCLEGAMKAKYKKYYRELDLEYGKLDEEERKSRKEIRDNQFNYPYKLLPGKELFKALKQKIHKIYSVSIVEEEVAKNFTEEELPEEIKKALEFFKPENK